MATSPHTFHIPVMGTGFTIDTPLRVAKYGIHSVVSISDDRLIEKMREYHSLENGEEFVPIPRDSPGARSKRITAYLNLLNKLVKRQVDCLKKQPFTADSDITRYFQLLPAKSVSKQLYLEMKYAEDAHVKMQLIEALRSLVVPGRIDVNLMVKVDRDNFENGEVLPQEYSDAMSALRGYAESDLESRIVFSAGFNPRVYNYAAQFDDFYPDKQGFIKKKVVLKVSDFRSAMTQGKFLAKKGVWVSEFRIESGLNCGGHAFATDGQLMGPVLEEFKTKRDELKSGLWALYSQALVKLGRALPQEILPMTVTAQGGVGTNAEHVFLKRYYKLESIGWGSPFLLVPEATCVDRETLKLLASDDKEIYLSGASPLGVPFYNLRNSKSELQRLERIEAGKPGSPCPYGHLAFSTEFGKPLCTASRAYQEKKLAHAPAEEKTVILDKACICHDLAAGAYLKYEIKPPAPMPMTPAICPGPNLAFFNKIMSLSEMIDHIYGRANALSQRPRPHMLINELKIYLDYFKKRITKDRETFKKNLQDGIEYYKKLVHSFEEETEAAKAQFLEQLFAIESELAAAV